MKRKVRVLLTGAMIIILAGCGGGEGVPETETNTLTEEEAMSEEVLTVEEEAAETERKAPEADDDMITVGIVNSDPEESAYRTANDEDMKMTFTAENGYSASFAYGGKNDEQIEAAQEFIQDGVDYLLLSALDTAGWDSVLMDAQDAGVRVILFDRMLNVDESLYETSVLPDLDKEGEAAVAWLEDQGLGSYHIIHLQGAMGSAEQKGRTGALSAKVGADADWTFVAQETAEWDAETAQRIVRSVINSGEPFNVIYAESDDMAKGAVAALDEAGISHGAGGKVTVVSFGCHKWALEELLAQNWNYDGQCNPFQSSYIDETIKIIETGGEVEKAITVEEIGIDASFITAEDIEDYGI